MCLCLYYVYMIILVDILTSKCLTFLCWYWHLSQKSIVRLKKKIKVVHLMVFFIAKNNIGLAKMQYKHWSSALLLKINT